MEASKIKELKKDLDQLLKSGVELFTEKQPLLKLSFFLNDEATSDFEPNSTYNAADIRNPSHEITKDESASHKRALSPTAMPSQDMSRAMRTSPTGGIRPLVASQQGFGVDNYCSLTTLNELRGFSQYAESQHRELANILLGETRDIYHLLKENLLILFHYTLDAVLIGKTGNKAVVSRNSQHTDQLTSEVIKEDQRFTSDSFPYSLKSKLRSLPHHDKVADPQVSHSLNDDFSDREDQQLNIHNQNAVSIKYYSFLCSQKDRSTLLRNSHSLGHAKVDANSLLSIDNMNGEIDMTDSKPSKLNTNKQDAIDDTPVTISDLGIICLGYKTNYKLEDGIGTFKIERPSACPGSPFFLSDPSDFTNCSPTELSVLEEEYLENVMKNEFKGDNGLFSEYQGKGFNFISGDANNSPKEGLFGSFEETFQPYYFNFNSSLDADPDRLRLQTLSSPYLYKRCVSPVIDPQFPLSPHVAIQLGLFTAKQYIISPMFHMPKAFDRRYCPSFCDSDHPKKIYELCSMPFFSNSAFIKFAGDTAEENGNMNEEDNNLFPFDEARRIPYNAIDLVTSKFRYCDILESLEVLKNEDNLYSFLPESQGNTLPISRSLPSVSSEGSDDTDESYDESEASIWCSDDNANQVLEYERTFDGKLIRIDCNSLETNLSKAHGSAVDLLIVSVIFISVGKSLLTVSETMYFSSDSNIFFGKNTSKASDFPQTAVTFLPHSFSETIHLLFRIYRPCTDDHDTVLNLYTKGERGKASDVSKLSEKYRIFTSPLLLQELGWCSVAWNSLKVKPALVKITKIIAHPLSNESIYNILRKEKGSGEMKIIDVDFSFQISDVSNLHTLLPKEISYQKPEESERLIELVDPSSDNNISETFHFFPCSLPILSAECFSAYVNVCYLHFLNFKILSSSVSKEILSTHKTFVIHVCFKDNDKILDAEGIPCLYKQFFTTSYFDGGRFLSAGCNLTEYNMHDEAKFQLPYHLTSEHHFLFTLYALCTKLTVPNGLSRMIKIGFSVLPILNQDGSLVTKTSKLTFLNLAKVHSHLSEGYSSLFQKASTHDYLNSGNPILSVRTQSRSSVYASNPVMAYIFKVTTQCLPFIRRKDNISLADEKFPLVQMGETQDLLIKLTSSIIKLPLSELLGFFPFLFYILLIVIISPSSEINSDVRCKAFEAFLSLLAEGKKYEKMLLQSGSPQSHITQKPNDSANSVNKSWDLVRFLIYYSPLRDICFQDETSGEGYHQSTTESTSFCHSECLVIVLVDLLQSSFVEIAENLQKLIFLLPYILDILLRLIYFKVLDSDSKLEHRRTLFSDIFYSHLHMMLLGLIKIQIKLNKLDSTLDIFLFLRNLARVCDRDWILRYAQEIAGFLHRQKCFKEVILLIDTLFINTTAGHWMLLHPRWTQSTIVTDFIFSYIGSYIVDSSEDIRTFSWKLVLSLVGYISTNSLFAYFHVRCVAAKIFTQFIVAKIIPQWDSIRESYYRHLKPFDKQNSQSDSGLSSSDPNRNSTISREFHFLSITILWVVYYVPPHLLESWITQATNRHLLAFFSLFSMIIWHVRCRSGKVFENSMKKKTKPRLVEAYVPRSATLAVSIGVKILDITLKSLFNTTENIQKNTSRSFIDSSLNLIESCLYWENPTVAIQIGASAFYQFTIFLFPELLAAEEDVLIRMLKMTFSLLASPCVHIQSICSNILLHIWESCSLLLNNMLQNLYQMSIQAFISTSKLKVLSFPDSYVFVKRALQWICDTLHTDFLPSIVISPDYVKRYNFLISQFNANPNSDIGEISYHIPFTNIARVFHLDSKYRPAIRISSSFLSSFPSMSEESKACSTPLSALILRNTTDESLLAPRYEFLSSIASPFERSFSNGMLKFTSLLDSLLTGLYHRRIYRDAKWGLATEYGLYHLWLFSKQEYSLAMILDQITALQEFHELHGHWIEAGIALLILAGLGFRLTELFYVLHGSMTAGVSIPYGVYAVVFWHDYVRLLPELSTIFDDNTCARLLESLITFPTHSIFKLMEHINLLRKAGSYFLKSNLNVVALSVWQLAERLSMCFPSLALTQEIYHQMYPHMTSSLTSMAPSAEYVLLSFFFLPSPAAHSSLGDENSYYNETAPSIYRWVFRLTDFLSSSTSAKSFSLSFSTQLRSFLGIDEDRGYLCEMFQTRLSTMLSIISKELRVTSSASSASSTSEFLPTTSEKDQSPCYSLNKNHNVTLNGILTVERLWIKSAASSQPIFPLLTPITKNIFHIPSTTLPSFTTPSPSAQIQVKFTSENTLSDAMTSENSSFVFSCTANQAFTEWWRVPPVSPVSGNTIPPTLYVQNYDIGPRELPSLTTFATVNQASFQEYSGIEAVIFITQVAIVEVLEEEERDEAFEWFQKFLPSELQFASLLPIYSNTYLLEECLYRVLTPLGMEPPGEYYVQALNIYPEREEIRELVRYVIFLARGKLSIAEKENSAITNWESYPFLIKGLADMDVALLSKQINQ